MKNKVYETRKRGCNKSIDFKKEQVVTLQAERKTAVSVKHEKIFLSK